MRIADILRTKGSAVATVTATTTVTGLLAELAVHNIGAMVVIGTGTGGQERSDSGISSGSGTVNVELGGLARTDNSGWGGEFEKLSHRVAGADRASIERVAEGV